VNQKNIYLFFAFLESFSPTRNSFRGSWRTGCTWLIFRQLFANRIGGFFGLDVLVSSVVLIRFVHAEGQRLGVRQLWLPILGLLTVGVSCALPLFLYLRESALQGRVASARFEPTPAEFFCTPRKPDARSNRASGSS